LEDRLTIEIDETTLTAIVRAEVSSARDRGETVDDDVSFALAIADLLQIPDDALFFPAVVAAMKTPTQLNDPASIRFTREIAIAAGYGKLAEQQGQG
jgi:hypothetical protein